MPTAVLEDGTAFYRLVTKDGGGDETLPGDLKMAEWSEPSGEDGCY